MDDGAYVGHTATALPSVKSVLDVVMNEPSDFSSELQRKYFEASQLSSPDEIVAYLDRVCGDDREEKKLLLQMLFADPQKFAEAMVEATDHAEQIRHVVDSAVKQQRFLEEGEPKWPQVERYKLSEVLGTGAMGRVFAAEQQSPIVRQVAIKVIKPSASSSHVLARFEREKQTLATLDHPNICQIFDAGVTADGDPYLAMELVRGSAIDEVCRTKQLSIDDRLKLVIDVCKATHHAHSCGIIHRDLKPANVLVKVVDAECVVKVIDFGVAKVLTADPTEMTYQTYFRQLIGTPMYMSPEQVDLETRLVDARSDVYSIGGLLYELLTGYAPLHEFTPSNTSLLKRIQEHVPPLASAKLKMAMKDPKLPAEAAGKMGVDVSQLASWSRRLRGDLDTVLSLCLSKSAEDRYPTALALAEDLQRVLGGEPIQGRRRRFVFSAQQWQRGLTTVALAAVIGLLVWKTWLQQPPTAIIVNEGSKGSLPVIPADIRQREFDLLEAARLQEMLAALQKRDLATARQIQLPSLDGEQEGEGSASQPAGPSLVKFLQDLVTPQPLLEISHDAPVNAMAVSPDKRLLVTACDDRFAHLWSLPGGRDLGKLGPHAGKVTAVEFSPDGKMLVTGDQEGAHRLWKTSDLSQLEAGAEVTPLYRSNVHDAGIESFAFSPDQQQIAVGYRYEPVVIYDLEGNELTRIKLQGDLARNESLMFSEDGTALILSDRFQKRLDCLDLDTLQSRWFVEPGNGPTGGGYPRDFERCREHYFFVDEGEKVWVTNASTGAEVMQPLPLISSVAKAVAVSPEGRTIVTGHAQGKINVMKNLVQIGQEEWKCDEPLGFAVHLSENQASVSDLLFLDESNFLSAGGDGKVLLWNLDRFELFTSPVSYVTERGMIDLQGQFYGVDISEAEVQIVRASFDEEKITRVTIPTLRSESFQQKEIFPPGSSRTKIVVAPDQAEPYGAAVDGNRIVFFDLKSGMQIGEHRVDGEQFLGLEISSDGKFLVTRSAAKLSAWQWDSSSAQIQFMWDVDISSIPDLDLNTSIGICNAGQTLILCGRYRVLSFERRTSRNAIDIRSTNQSHIKLSPSGQLIAIFDDQHLLVVRVDDGEEVFVDRSTVYFAGLQFCDRERILLATDRRQGLVAIHLPTQVKLGLVLPWDEFGSIWGFTLSEPNRLFFYSIPNLQPHTIAGRIYGRPIAGKN